MKKKRPLWVFSVRTTPWPFTLLCTCTFIDCLDILTLRCELRSVVVFVIGDNVYFDGSSCTWRYNQDFNLLSFISIADDQQCQVHVKHTCLLASLDYIYVAGHRKISAKYISTKEESVQFSEPAPVRRLTQYLDLTSHPKDRVANRKNKLHELVCYCLSHRYGSCTRSCCWGSNLRHSDPKAGVLTTRPSCSSPHIYSYISTEKYLCRFSDRSRTFHSSGFDM